MEAEINCARTIFRISQSIVQLPVEKEKGGALN
jgi:hypothetical protein